MIFYSFNQLNTFLIFLFFGLFLELFYNILEIVFLLNSQKKLKNIIINSVFYIIFALFFVILLNIFNFGLFSIVLTATYVLGFIWLKIVSKKLVVFYQEKWYNVLNKRKTNAKKFKKN